MWPYEDCSAEPCHHAWLFIYNVNFTHLIWEDFGGQPVLADLNFSAWILVPKSSQVTSKHITQKIPKLNQAKIPKQINPKTGKEKKKPILTEDLASQY